MGYSQYFYKFPKHITEGLKNCNTVKDVYDFCTFNGIRSKCQFDEEDFYIPPYEIGSYVYDLGKCFEGWKEVQATGYPLWKEDSELGKGYYDYDIWVVDRTAIKAVIEQYRQKIVNIYEDLLREQSVDKWNKTPQLERLKRHVNDYLFNWKHIPYNLDMDTPNIVRSWLYEHAIFELVRLYKTFDFEQYDLIFFGY